MNPMDHAALQTAIARASFAERVGVRIGLLGLPRLVLFAARIEAGDSPCEAFRRAVRP